MPRKSGASVVTTLVISVGLLPASSAGATPTLTLATGPDPTESIATQLVGSGATEGTNTQLAVTMRPSGGQGCGANYNADTSSGGATVLFSEGLAEGAFSKSANQTFNSAGSFLLCGWLSDRNQGGSPVVATASLTVAVRPPHLALSISAPATVAVGQTFQIASTAQAEVARSVTINLVPNVGRGCPANSSAASGIPGSRTVVSEWSVNGGPFSKTVNETINSAGAFLVCGYVQYPNTQSPPEIAASATITVVSPPPPCIVPAFSSAATRLKGAEQSVRAGGCVPGRIRRVASRRVRSGYVIGLSPVPGTHLASGAMVAITISTGPPCIVPRVAPGTALSVVEVRLAANHCSPGVITKASSRHYRRGRVLRLGVKTGQALASHATVGIVIAAGHHRRRH